MVIDALYYTSTTYKPHTLIDLATLTGYVLLIFLSDAWVTEY